MPSIWTGSAALVRMLFLGFSGFAGSVLDSRLYKFTLDKVLVSLF
jgi:hypothetical protein